MQSHLIIKPRLSLPAKPSSFATEPMLSSVKPSQVPTRPLHTHRKRRLSIIAEQLLYAFVAGALSSTAWYFLAGMVVYRVVALVVIGILWSSFAGRAALRRPVDMQETISLPAFPIGDYADETYTYLKAVKKNLVGR